MKHSTENDKSKSLNKILEDWNLKKELKNVLDENDVLQNMITIIEKNMSSLSGEEQKTLENESQKLVAWMQSHFSEYENHPEIMIEALGNSLLWDSDRIKNAQTMLYGKALLQKDMSDIQKESLLDAHNSPGTIFCLSDAELATKTEILTKGGWNSRQAKMLIYYGYAWNIFKDIERFVWTMFLWNCIERGMTAPWSFQRFIHHAANISRVAYLILILSIIITWNIKSLSFTTNWTINSLPLILIIVMEIQSFGLILKHKTWKDRLKDIEEVSQEKTDPRSIISKEKRQAALAKALFNLMHKHKAWKVSQEK